MIVRQIAAVRRKNPQNVFKLFDTNHLHKNFQKKLFTLQKIFKEMRHEDTIPHLKLYFSYAITQNQGKISQIAALRNIPHHVFGFSSKLWSLVST